MKFLLSYWYQGLPIRQSQQVDAFKKDKLVTCLVKVMVTISFIKDYIHTFHQTIF